MNNQKNKFLLNKKYGFLNCAYMAPLLKKSENAGRKGISRKRQPNLIGPDDFFHDVKTIKLLFSELINNPEPTRIAMIPSASYGIGNAVNNIEINKDDNVVVTMDQFPSNIYPWKTKCDQNEAELKIIAAPDTKEKRGQKWNEEILNAIDNKTKAVAIGHVHWADGTLFDLMAIRAKCDEVGAYLVIDGTQSIGALPFDVQQVKPDALIVASYKWLLGPYSLGVAYYGTKFDKGQPIEQNWINRKDSDDFAGLVNYQDEYQSSAHRFEVGEKSNFILNPMLIASLKQILNWEVENIQDYCKTLSEPFIDQFREMGLYIEQSDARSSHLFGIEIPVDKIESLQTQLKAHKVSVSMRGQYMRVSPHVYNDERDFNKLAKALKATF
ncbi:MAG: aminotransferase class V-fold PLP-dependent enzyme [Reichenbachiella sp.]